MLYVYALRMEDSSLFDGLKAWAGKTIRSLIKKGDVNWWVNFLKMAHDEDAATHVNIGDVMKNHAWVNICVSARAKNIARAKFQILSGDKPLESGPIYDLFTNVNPGMSRFQLWEATESFLWARGECIWIYNDDYTMGIPTEIYPLDPRNFKHVLDPSKRKITMWKYKSDHQEIPFLPDELIHWKLWNPWDMFRGVSPAYPLAYEVNQDYLAAKSNLNILRHGSVPDGLLSAKEAIEPEEAKRIKLQWKKEHQGADRAHTIAVLGHGVEYQAIALTAQDMEFSEMKNWNRSAVFAKYGVFPGVVGVKDKTTPLSGKDRQEEMKAFWTLSLIPELKFFEDKLKTDFFNRLKTKELIPQFSLDDIPELQEDEDEKYKRYGEAIGRGFMTINEARDRLGFELPVSWGDSWWKQFSLTDVQESQSDMRNVTPPPKQIEPTKVKVLCELFERPISKTQKVYTEIYRTNHWWKMARAETDVEKDYKKEIRQWFYNQRSRHLAIIAEHLKSITVKADLPWKDLEDELLDDHYWAEQASIIRETSQKYFILGLELTGDDLLKLFSDLGMEAAESFTIYDTGAIEKLNNRLDKVSGVTDTIRDQMKDTIKDGIEGGWTESELSSAIRDKYNIAQNRSDTIARTELGGVINDSRIEGFTSVGFGKHSWLSARDGSVRDLHMIDGEIVKIGEQFSNGLRYPNDPEGEPENVINCFIPDTLMQGQITCGSRLKYAGPIKMIKTSRGNNLTVTPNHPIMTSRGWMPADEICEGMDLLCYTGKSQDSLGITGIHNAEIPARIEDVFNSMQCHSRSMVAENNFHGDGQFGYGYIDIVFPERILLLYDESVDSLKNHGKLIFAEADNSMLAESLFSQPV